jgi:hypothetical protein
MQIYNELTFIVSIPKWAIGADWGSRDIPRVYRLRQGLSCTDIRGIRSRLNVADFNDAGGRGIRR